MTSPGEVTIFDEVVLPAAAVDRWLERWRTEYRPGASARGLALQGVWRGHTEDPEHALVVIQWSVETIEGFFAARGQSGHDPRVAGFWRSTDELAIARNRRVLTGAGVSP